MAAVGLAMSINVRIHLAQQAELATTAAATARLEDQLRHAEEELEAAHGKRLVLDGSRKLMSVPLKLTTSLLVLANSHPLAMQRWWSSSGWTMHMACGQQNKSWNAFRSRHEWQLLNPTFPSSEDMTPSGTDA